MARHKSHHGHEPPGNSLDTARLSGAANTKLRPSESDAARYGIAAGQSC